MNISDILTYCARASPMTRICGCSAVCCRRLFEEKGSGAKRDRPELAWLLDIAEELNDVDASLRSLGEPWADTTSPAGRMVRTVLVGIA